VEVDHPRHMNAGGSAWAEWDPEHPLPEDEVHVWRVSLDVAPSIFLKLSQVLSQSERERADRFRFEIDRRRSVIGRGCLRLLLGRILSSRPEALEIHSDEFGKPSLTGKQAALQFNLSHSGNAVLIAIARGRAVGVDVEKIRTDLALDEIATRFFSANECNALATLTGSARYLGFFTCWARKEAYLKARGVGLSLPLHEFDVSFLPHERPRLLATRHDPPDANRWRLVALNVSPDYAAAVAAAGDWTLKCWDLNLPMLMNEA
jgi:4'-phosphopantetheinyl transferase